MFSDEITGNAKGNRIEGGEGDDTIVGGGSFRAENGEPDYDNADFLDGGCGRIRRAGSIE